MLLNAVTLPVIHRGKTGTTSERKDMLQLGAFFGFINPEMPAAGGTAGEPQGLFPRHHPLSRLMPLCWWPAASGGRIPSPRSMFQGGTGKDGTTL